MALDFGISGQQLVAPQWWQGCFWDLLCHKGDTLFSFSQPASRAQTTYLLLCTLQCSLKWCNCLYWMGAASVGSQRCSFSPEQWGDLGQLGHLGKRKQAPSPASRQQALVLYSEDQVYQVHQVTTRRLCLAVGALWFTLGYQHNQRKGNVMVLFTYHRGSETSILAAGREPCCLRALLP